MRNDSSTVGLISNPDSGHNRSHFARIEQRVARCANVHHIVTRGVHEVDAALAQMAERNIRILAINGGDGTVSAILGRLSESTHFATPPDIVVLPGGTANMNAGDVGVKGSLHKAVKKFCEWCEAGAPQHGNTTRRSLMRVRDDAGTLHHTMFLGGGAIIHGTEYAHREIHSRGLRDDFSLILGTLRTVWGVLRNDPEFNRHVSVDVTLDNAPTRQFDTLILAISTLERLSFGMRPFWSTDRGAIRVTIMEQGCTRFARTFLSIIRGRPSRNAVPASGYHSHNADRIELHLQGNLNLDGEIIACNGNVEITATAPLVFVRL